MECRGDQWSPGSQMLRIRRNPMRIRSRPLPGVQCTPLHSIRQTRIASRGTRSGGFCSPSDHHPNRSPEETARAPGSSQNVYSEKWGYFIAHIPVL